MASSSSSVMKVTKYPYPSVAVNVESFVPFKLTEEWNYPVWRELILSLIESHGKLGFIDGKILPPDEKLIVDGEKQMTRNPDYELWRRSDCLVQGWILGSLSEELVRGLVHVTTARQVWLGLENKFKVDQSSDEEEEVTEDYRKYFPLYAAVMQSDWGIAKRFLDQEMDATTSPINALGETALHVAVGTNRDIDFVENLVNFIMECKDKDSLANQDKEGNTALHAAAKAGNKKAAMLLVDKNPDLLYIRNQSRFPLHDAAAERNRDIVVYLMSLYKRDPQHRAFKGEMGQGFFLDLVFAGFVDLATQLVEDYPDVTGNLKEYECTHILDFMLQMPSMFRSGASFSGWERPIYSYAPLRSKSEAIQKSGDIEDRVAHNGAQKNEHKFTRCHELVFQVFQKFHFTLWKIGGKLVPLINNIQDKKLMHQQARRLVEYLVDKIACLSDQKVTPDFKDVIIKATASGIHEALELILLRFPEALNLKEHGTGKTLFHVAIESRNEKVFNLIYQRRYYQKLFVDLIDDFEKCIIYTAARLAPPHKLNLVAGAALQMQRELQFFKEVQEFVHPSRLFQKKDGKTAQEIFTEEHKDLKIAGEQWLKDTANSCTIAAALITTVMFAAVFTVPGGNDQNKGFPVLQDKVGFTVFIVSDAISLFSSIMSLLMFLSILTSRYAEQDFLHSLPKRLSIGLLTLFISIIFMMIAFYATLHLILLDKKSWLPIAGAVLAGFPVTSFVLLQFPLLLDVFSSTYGPRLSGNRRQKLSYQ